VFCGRFPLRLSTQQSRTGPVIDGVLRLVANHLDLPIFESTPEVKLQAEPVDATEAHPCPHCGGRMIIIETFARGSMPRHRPTGPMIAIDTS
jgi:hypothetical protein